MNLTLSSELQAMGLRRCSRQCDGAICGHHGSGAAAAPDSEQKRAIGAASRTPWLRRLLAGRRVGPGRFIACGGRSGAADD
jgi:hypothetical protein